MGVDIIPVDLQLKGRHVLVPCIEGNILQQLLKDRMEAAGADILRIVVGVAGCGGDRVYRGILKCQQYAVHFQQGFVLLCQCVFRSGQDLTEVFPGKTLEVDMYREAALKLGNQVGHFADMESAGRDEQHEISLDSAVFGIDGAAFHDGQDIPLYSFPAYIRTMPAVAAGNLVNLIDKDDAVLFGACNGFFLDGVIVDQPGGFLVGDDFAGLTDFDVADARPLGHHVSHHVPETDAAAADFQRRGFLFHLKIQFKILNLTTHQLLADFFLFPGQRYGFLIGGLGLLLTAQKEIKRVSGIVFFRGMRQQIGKPFLSQYAGPRKNPFLVFLLDQTDGVFRQVTDNAFHIPAHIADFGKFGCFHLDKRCVDQLGEPAGNFGFSDAGRADHQDILRNDFIPEGFFHTASAVSVPQCDCDCFFGLVLADNKPVQFMYNLTGCKLLIHVAPSALQRFDNDMIVCEDADAGCDPERFLRDFSGGQICILYQRPGGCQRVISAGADRCDSFIRINDFTGTAQDQQMVVIRHDQHGLKMAHGLIAAPGLSQLDGCLFQVSAALLQFFFEFFAKSEGIRHASGKAGDHLSVKKPADFPGRGLEDGVFSHGYLSVAGNGDLPVLADSTDGGSLETTAHVLPPLLVDAPDIPERSL